MEVDQMIMLDAFLEAKDLDVLVQRASKLGTSIISVEYRIKQILENDWKTNSQAICNLLQCPYIIPEDVRNTCLLRGLKDENPYYVLSAIVGVQHRKFEEMSVVDEIKELLWKHVQESSGPTANRAFISLEQHLSIVDDKQLTKLLVHKEPTIRVNAFHAILRLCPTISEEQFSGLLAEACFPEKVISRSVTNFRAQKLKTEPDGLPNDTIISFIPNMEDFKQAQSYRKVIDTIFEQCPKIGNGVIGPRQLQAYMNSIDVPISEEDAQARVEEEDIYGKGGLDIHEFFNFMNGKINLSKKIMDQLQNLSPEASDDDDDEESEEDENEIPVGQTVPLECSSQSQPGSLDGLDELFKMFDVDLDGAIGKDDIRTSFSKLTGEEVTDEQADAMIQGADMDKDGKLNFQEFKVMMEKTMLGK